MVFCSYSRRESASRAGAAGPAGSSWSRRNHMRVGGGKGAREEGTKLPIAYMASCALDHRPPALSSARTTLAHHRGAILRPFTRSNRRRRNPTAAACGGCGDAGVGTAKPSSASGLGDGTGPPPSTGARHGESRLPHHRVQARGHEGSCGWGGAWSPARRIKLGPPAVRRRVEGAQPPPPAPPPLPQLS